MAPTIVCDVSALPEADLRTIDLLARLELTARRHGYDLRLQEVSRDLEDLIVFVGLEPVLPLQPKREAEEGEDALRVEEERELDDPAA